jgi:hypothetical protein
VIVLNCVVKSFVERIREKLRKLDLDRKLHVNQAPNTLALGHRAHLTGHQNAVVERLESGVDMQFCTLAHADYGVAHVVVDCDVNGLLSHLARAMNDVDHRDGVGGLAEMWHDGRVYLTGPRGAGWGRMEG